MPVNNPTGQAVWTPEQLATVKDLWLKGHSGTEISRKFPGRSRNAVIGVVHRNGWHLLGRAELPGGSGGQPTRPLAQRANKPPKPGPQNKPGAVFGNLKGQALTETRADRAKAGKAAIARVEAKDIESPNATPFLEARKGCKWPIGEGAALAMCCNPISRGSYCEGHAQIAFSPVPLRRDYRDGNHAHSLTRHDRVRASPRPKSANDGLWDARETA
jgi:hypothetical protein